jgi:hypothetical protein
MGDAGKSNGLEVRARKEGINSADERRQLPRLNLSSVQFRLSQSGRIFPLKDLSEGGMSFWLNESEEAGLFPIGYKLDGILNMQREKFPVTARVSSLSSDRIGCQFEALAGSTVQALKRFLDPAVLARELRPFPTPGVSNTLWYHGPTGTDLVFRHGLDGRYTVFTVYALGSYIHWEEESGLATGKTESSGERCEQQGVLRLETLLLTTDPAPDPQKLKVAKTLILSSNLPQDTKTWCIRQLEK